MGFLLGGEISDHTLGGMGFNLFTHISLEENVEQWISQCEQCKRIKTHLSGGKVGNWIYSPQLVEMIVQQCIINILAKMNDIASMYWQNPLLCQTEIETDQSKVKENLIKITNMQIRIVKKHRSGKESQACIRF